MKKRYMALGVVLLALIGGEAVLLNLAYWQYTRHERAVQNEQAALDIQNTAPVAPENVTKTYQPVTLTGTFDTTREVAVENSHLGGKRGYALLTPLVLENGKEVLVNRGFAQSVNILANFKQFAPISGQTTLTGYAHFPSTQKSWLTGPVYSTHPKLHTRINVRAIPAADGVVRYKYYVVQKENTQENITAFGLLPDRKIPHKQYMFTWVALSFLWPLMFGYAWFLQRPKRLSA